MRGGESSESIDKSKLSISIDNLYQLQFEATWAITNIASGTGDHTRYIVDLGCIPMVISLLASENDDLRQQSVWALGNVAGDSAAMRDYVLQLGIMPHILRLIINEPSTKVKRDGK